MSSNTFPPPPSPDRPFPATPHRLAGVRRVLLVLYLPIAVILALPSLGMGALIWWRASKTWDSKERWSGTLLMAVVGLLVYGFVSWFYHPLLFLFHSLSVDLSHFSKEPRSLVAGLRWLGFLWLLHLCFAPLCALILQGLHPLSKKARPLRRAHVLEPGTAGGDGVASSTTLLSSSWDVERQYMPAHAGQTLTAAALKPVERTAAGHFPVAQASPLEPLGAFLGGELDEWVYGGHLCIPVEALSLHGVVLGEPGYGKTISLLRLATIAARYGMQVIFIDLKGSKKTAAQFVAAMGSAGLERIKVFPREAYDGWRGDANAIYNRLMALADPGIHPYYARVDSTLVSLAVRAPCGPPRSSRDFLLRLNAGWLKSAYAGKAYWYEQRTIRKPAGLRTLTIIDEFGVLKTSNATNLYERVREAGMAMWAAAQSYHGLGVERASVLSASAIKILHRCGDPLEVVQYAGWREQPAFSQLLEEEENDAFILPLEGDVPKMRTSVRMQRVYAVPIEEVQQLTRGAIALITGGLGAWCQVYPLALPQELLHQAAAFVQALPAGQPSDTSIPPAPQQAQGRSETPASQEQRKKPSTSSPSQGTQRDGTTHPAAPMPTPPAESPEMGERAKANEQRPVVDEDDSPVDF